MSTISDLVGKRLPEIPSMPDPSRPHPHSSVGIEVEVENIPHNTPNGKRWRVYTDEGSILNGVEFISDPVWGTGITDAIEELDTILGDLQPYISSRCSVHIHANILDLEADQLKHLIHLYTVYERPLFRLHDNWDRKNSPFCIPAYGSVALQKSYAQLIYHLDHGARPRPNYLGTKYSAMNPNNIATLGTLEFRHMGGTTDVFQIDQWINLILQLKSAAIRRAPLLNPEQVWGPYLDRLRPTEAEMQDGEQIVQTYSIWR